MMTFKIVPKLGLRGLDVVGEHSWNLPGTSESWF
jgi:hypothetical protein